MSFLKCAIILNLLKLSPMKLAMGGGIITKKSHMTLNIIFIYFGAFFFSILIASQQ